MAPSNATLNGHNPSQAQALNDIDLDEIPDSPDWTLEDEEHQLPVTEDTARESVLEAVSKTDEEATEVTPAETENDEDTNLEIVLETVFKTDSEATESTPEKTENEEEILAIAYTYFDVSEGIAPVCRHNHKSIEDAVDCTGLLDKRTGEVRHRENIELVEYRGIFIQLHSNDQYFRNSDEKLIVPSINILDKTTAVIFQGDEWRVVPEGEVRIAYGYAVRIRELEAQLASLKNG